MSYFNAFLFWTGGIVGFIISVISDNISVAIVSFCFIIVALFEEYKVLKFGK